MTPIAWKLKHYFSVSLERLSHESVEWYKFGHYFEFASQITNAYYDVTITTSQRLLDTVADQCCSVTGGTCFHPFSKSVAILVYKYTLSTP